MINVWTDASHFPEDNTGTYAYWVQDEHGHVHKGSGTLSNITYSTQAELHAMYMALFVVAILERKENLITFWTDSLQGCHLMYKGNEKYPIQKQINKFNYEYIGSQLIFNYIPRNSTKEHKWCDKQTKKL